MNFFRWMWGKMRAAPETAVGPPDETHDLKTRCPNCGYEGDESEFLTEDPGNTICPKCGEDSPTYEM